jgi:aspartyl-tRNA synthetase
MNLKRTNTCGTLREKNAGEVVTIAGWVHKVRDMGKVRFCDIRDRYGLTQVVFDPSISKDAANTGMKLKPEWVITIKGTVARRPVGQENENLPTGEIEIKAEEVQIDNECPTPPIYIDRDGDEDRDTRWRYRYLELRRKTMQEKIIKRHEAFKFIREFLNAREFIDIETPFLTKSTPEGARDFIVPSRMEPGKFYALPQSPQMFKQLCMVAGFDKYYQIVRCFRDEDMRADRALEFTQLDLEMSFVDQNDIFELMEELFVGLFKDVAGIEIKSPFKRLTYEQAMGRYGSDKPDLRFGMSFVDLTETLKDSEVKVFRGSLDAGGIIKGIKIEGQVPSRTQIDNYAKAAQTLGAKGLAHFIHESGGLRSPLAKHLTDEEKDGIVDEAKMKVGDTLFVMADQADVVLPVLGELRIQFAKEYDLIPENEFAFLWVYDFPLFGWSEFEGKIVSEHHPFTAPNWKHWQEWHENGKPMEKEDVFKIGSQSYDLVINGIEMGSGSVRIHRPDVQRDVFRILGLTEEDIDKQFGFMIEALSYGAPPHAGVAPGLDRIVRLITKDESIADIIPFPKTLKGADLMSGCPSELPQEYLDPLGIKVKD